MHVRPVSVIMGAPVSGICTIWMRYIGAGGVACEGKIWAE